MINSESGIMKGMEDSNQALFYGTTPATACNGKRKTMRKYYMYQGQYINLGPPKYE
jgi:hypothetical protein